MTDKDNVGTHVMFLKELLTPIKDYNFEPDLVDKIEGVCKKIMIEKDKDYGGSWQKDGLLSAHMNLKRKFDRLHTIFLNGFSTEVADETVLDTLIDLRNYTTLYISFLTQKDDNFNTLMENLND